MSFSNSYSFFLCLLHQDTLSHLLPSSYSSLPRNIRISVPHEHALSTSSPYSPQPISRIAIPPASSGVRKERPIPLSVIIRLQMPNYGRYSGAVGEPQQEIFHQPQEYLQQNQTPQPQRQPPYYRKGTFTQKPRVSRQKLVYELTHIFWSASINKFKNT